MTSYYKGETITIEVAVLEDGVAADLNGATAVIGLKQNGNDLITKNCTIAENVVSATLESTDTLNMSGTYTYEVKVTDINGDIDIVKKDTIKIENSIFVE